MSDANAMRAYLAASRALHDHIESQMDTIAAAAHAIADRLANGGVIAVFDSGHMLQHEAYLRAGGLAAVTPFRIELSTGTELPARPNVENAWTRPDHLSHVVRAAIASSGLTKNDVLLINSNSGRSAHVIELAIQARDLGVLVIGIASAKQMATCKAGHPTKQKLDAVVDHLLDNGSSEGDAVLPVPNNEAMCPLSGIGSALCYWALTAAIVDALTARGIRPTIYRSVHLGGEAYFAQQQADYKERGI